MASIKNRLKDRFKSNKSDKPDTQDKEDKPRKSFLDSLRDGPIASYKKRVKKENDALANEGKGMRIIAFALTFISMTLAMSFIPFLPQPLPILLAVLLAFGVYLNPVIGMSVGSVFISLGILYQMSLLDFIGMLGPTVVRVLFICVLIFFFVALTIRFRSFEDAIGINLGIIAAMLLFSNSTFFMAIPLLLTVAIIFKRTQAGLAFSYYVLISVPLMLMQYYQHILTITRTDFWNDPTAVPPIYTSLSSIFTHMQSEPGLAHFRLFDLSQTLGKITYNVVEIPPTPIHTALQAVNQYSNSFPGIVLLIVLVGGLVWAISLILPSLVRSGNLTQGEKLFPVITAAGVTALFFIFVSSLQVPLSFSASISETKMILGVLSSIAFAIPAVLFSFAPKKKVENEKNSQLILAKVGDLMKTVTAFEETVGKVKETVPVDVSSPEIRKTLIKERLTEILTKAEARKFKLRETYTVLNELDVNLAEGANGLLPELNAILEHYQLQLNYLYASWLKKLKEIGYEVQNPFKIEFQKDQPAESRAEYISSALASSRLLGNDVCQLSEKIYSALRSIYDPALPDSSGTVAYCKQKLADKAAPWIACDALVIALKSWAKQYEPRISMSIDSLQKDLGPIVSLGTQNEDLETILGEKYPLIFEETKRADELLASLRSRSTNILNLVVLQDFILSLLEVSRKIVSTIYEELKDKEESIERLLPVKDGFWEKNVVLREQTESAIKKISDSANYSVFDMLKNLTKAMSFIEPCIWTIAQYRLKNELLLNYPIAKKAIEDQLKKQRSVSIQDLPFEGKEAEEYLKLFFNEKNGKFTFDEENQVLARKT